MAAKGKFRLKAVETPEDSLQRTVAHLLEVALLPPAVFTCTPVGMYELGVKERVRLKTFGLKAGWPDLIACYDGRSIGIELKRPSGAPSKSQKAMHPKLEAAGVHVYICRTPEAVIDALDREQFPVRPEIVRQLRRDGPFFRAERQSTGDLYYGEGELQAKSRRAA